MNRTTSVLVFAGVMGAAVMFCVLMVALPKWNVWRQGLAGEAALKRAQQEKRILVEQARAEVESSKLRAEAISVVGEAAQKFPEYRLQEFMGAFAEALQSGSIDQIVYVPTEANVPLVKAVR